MLPSRFTGFRVAAIPLSSGQYRPDRPSCTHAPGIASFHSPEIVRAAGINSSDNSNHPKREERVRLPLVASMTILLKKYAGEDGLPDPLTWMRYNVGTPEERVVICGDKPGLYAMIRGGKTFGGERHDWDIAPDGSVTPSILINAPHIGEWHEFVKLEGWDG